MSTRYFLRYALATDHYHSNNNLKNLNRIIVLPIPQLISTLSECDDMIIEAETLFRPQSTMVAHGQCRTVHLQLFHRILHNTEHIGTT